ncbi:MAG: hypothetical protein JW982_00630 [Spirochaetes bacterium]|nr:hypothetical protein [Spirochaetota bacterium]
MITGRPVWGENCDDCRACLNYCPKGSINISGKTIGRKRYHHPAVSASKISKQKKDVS